MSYLVFVEANLLRKVQEFEEYERQYNPKRVKKKQVKKKRVKKKRTSKAGWLRWIGLARKLEAEDSKRSKYTRVYQWVR